LKWIEVIEVIEVIDAVDAENNCTKTEPVVSTMRLKKLRIPPTVSMK
jgi:hypothetical protein